MFNSVFLDYLGVLDQSWRLLELSQLAQLEVLGIPAEHLRLLTLLVILQAQIKLRLPDLFWFQCTSVEPYLRLESHSQLVSLR